MLLILEFSNGKEIIGDVADKLDFNKQDLNYDVTEPMQLLKMQDKDGVKLGFRVYGNLVDHKVRFNKNLIIGSYSPDAELKKAYLSTIEQIQVKSGKIIMPNFNKEIINPNSVQPTL